MQKLYDKQVRYQMSEVVDDNIETFEASLSNSPRAANAQGINNDMPWISKTAMDQEYREWRRGNRVVTGSDADQQRQPGKLGRSRRKKSLMSGIREADNSSEGNDNVKDETRHFFGE